MQEQQMTEQEALEILKRDWPEWNSTTEKQLEDGESMVEWLSILESFA